MIVKFTKPYLTGNELKYIKDVIEYTGTLSGDGVYTKKVQAFLEQRYGAQKALLTTSATTALEFAVRLLHLKPGEEVIAPSFTFSSTVNAILLDSGLKVVFADIDPRTFNIDPNDIEKRITKRTRALMVVHYAGVACDMDAIMAIAKRYNLKVIEDAAQAIESTYKGRFLGTIGDFGCISFHDTKNIVCGEGGALLINNQADHVLQAAEIIREKGTNRTQFLEGVVDKYTWIDIGSSYLPSDILAAFLYAQLEAVEEITKKRLNIYNNYKNAFAAYEDRRLIALPFVPEGAKHNAHIFYIVLPNERARSYVMRIAKEAGVSAVFHYIPLHSAPQGQKLGYGVSDMPITEKMASRLLRLPLYAQMTKAEQEYVIDTISKALNTLTPERFESHKLSRDPRVPYSQRFFSSLKSITRRPTV